MLSLFLSFPLRARRRRVKSTLSIEKDHPFSLEEYPHVWLTIVPGIDELQRHWNQIGVRPIEMRSQVDFCVRCIPGGKVDDLDLSLEIEGDEMAGMRHTIALADDCLLYT